MKEEARSRAAAATSQQRSLWCGNGVSVVVGRAAATLMQRLPWRAPQFMPPHRHGRGVRRRCWSIRRAPAAAISYHADAGPATLLVLVVRCGDAKGVVTAWGRLGGGASADGTARVLRGKRGRGARTRASAAAALRTSRPRHSRHPPRCRPAAARAAVAAVHRHRAKDRHRGRRRRRHARRPRRRSLACRRCRAGSHPQERRRWRRTNIPP